MNNVYHITQIRMIRDLEEFSKKQTISGFVLKYLKENGIEKTKFYEFCSGMTRKQIRSLHKILINAYYYHTKDNNEIDLQIRYDLEDAYFTITNNLITKSTEYCFPSVLNKYRRDINPVRALYFDILELEFDFVTEFFLGSLVKSCVKLFKRSKGFKLSSIFSNLFSISSNLWFTVFALTLIVMNKLIKIITKVFFI